MQENYKPQTSDDEIDLLKLASTVFHRLPFLILTAVLGFVVAVAYLSVAVPQYQTSTSILVTPLKGSSSMEGLLGSSNLSSTTAISTEVELIKSKETVTRAKNMLDLTQYRDGDGVPYSEKQTLDATVTTSQKSGTRNVIITVTGPNPVFAADYANAIAIAFQDLLSDITKQSSRNQISTIQNQIPVNEAQLSASLDELSAFKSENGTEQMVNKIALLTKRIAAIQMQKNPLELEMSDAVGKLSAMNREVLDLASYPVLESRLSLYAKSIKETILYTDLGEQINSERLFALESQNKSLSQEILSTVQTITSDSEYARVLSDYLTVRTRITVLGEIESLYSDELSSYQVVQSRLQELVSNVEVNQQLLLSLKKMLEEAKVVEASDMVNVSIIDKAKVPGSPISPRKFRVAALGILLGGFFGVAWVVVETLFDRTVKSEEDIRKTMDDDVPFLGWIPYVKTDKSERKSFKRTPLYALSAKESYAAERYRLLSTNLEYVCGDDKKVLVVNSADIGDGKTSVTCNIAASLAVTGKKVLIIDGDLRRPELERAMDIARCRTGLTSILIDGLSYQDCIVRPSKELDNLHVLAAGRSSKNPNIVFNSNGFADLMKTLRGIYDYIFIDCPPLSYGSDFGNIAKHIDGYIFNIRAGFTTNDQIADFLENRAFIPCPLLGYVFYGALEGKDGYGYGYSYGGKYGYGKYSYSSRYSSGYGYGYSSGYSKGIFSKLRSGFSLRRKTNYKRIQRDELAIRKASVHTYGVYKAELAYQNGFENAFGNLSEVEFMKATLSKNENKE